MRARVKMIVQGLQQFVLSPLLPATAVMLIALFTVSLALAEPHSEGAQALTSHSYAIAEDDASLSDTISEADTAIVSTPLPAPNYHDRYRFYHRYDLAPRSRFNPLDDGIN